MEPWLVILSVVAVALVLWYVPLIVWTYQRKKRPTQRFHGSYRSSSTSDADAAIATAVIGSTIDASHHG